MTSDSPLSNLVLPVERFFIYRKSNGSNAIPTFKHHFNPFIPNTPFLYLLKISTICFQGIEKECIGKEWVKFLNGS